jgi:ankyrin repeat protein
VPRTWSSCAAASQKDWTPLHQAMASDQAEAARLLIEGKADVNARTKARTL